VLTFRENEIIAIERGPAFDAAEWARISEEIEKSILVGPLKVGREFSFSSFRVTGSWRGERSGVQILPPPADAPRADVEMAQHPFILEFPIRGSDFWPVTNHRRRREHRNLTLLLNILLAGRTSLQSQRLEHFWARVPRDGGKSEIKWVQQFFFGRLGEAMLDEPSPLAAEQLEQVEPEEYYTRIGHDGRGLRVPADLDESICCYTALSTENRAKLDRAAFWLDMASRQWNTSVSASFASLVSAIESLTERGNRHRFQCSTCGESSQHEVPGATQRFRDFLGAYAPGATLAGRRNEMYRLRSDILHGSKLMRLDQDLALGLDPLEWGEGELHDELWGLTQIAVRNWLKNPPRT
jgi:hypothetical protein